MNITGKLLFATLAYIAASTAVDAADLGGPKVPAKPAAVEAPAILAPAAAGFRTGAFIEGSLGMGIDTYAVAGDGASVSFSESGAIGGLAIGYDYKLGAALFIGVMGGVDFSNVAAKITDGDATAKISHEPSYYLAGRVGFTPAEHLMVYALAGPSWSKLKAKAGDESGSENFQGWLIGFGADFLLNQNLTLGARYAADLVKEEAGLEPTNHVVRAVLGYRF